ncbi:MAG: hypothetical protein HC898_11760 [Phycisphaerales bacterium]|nr:hypothetical protein [Phycisphaerales bacterium]
MAEGGNDNLVCPHCIEPIGRFDHFCPHCARPVSAHASIDPMGQVFSAGQAYQNATDNPRLIVVVGMWLIFGPQVPFLVLGLFVTVGNLLVPRNAHAHATGPIIHPVPDGLALELVRVLVLLALLLLYGFILHKVTTRYFNARSAKQEDTMKMGKVDD